MNLPIILGTARKGRQSEKVAKYIFEEVKKNNIKTEILDVRDYRLKATDNTKKTEKAKKLKNKIKKADGIIIVSPEYNHSYPGELKMMLDLLYEEYKGLPVIICGVSAGGLGGARMVELLKNLLVTFKMIPVGDLYFSNIEEKENFDESEKIKTLLSEMKKYT